MAENLLAWGCCLKASGLRVVKARIRSMAAAQSSEGVTPEGWLCSAANMAGSTCCDPSTTAVDRCIYKNTTWPIRARPRSPPPHPPPALRCGIQPPLEPGHLAAIANLPPCQSKTRHWHPRRPPSMLDAGCASTRGRSVRGGGWHSRPYECGRCGKPPDRRSASTPSAPYACKNYQFSPPCLWARKEFCRSCGRKTCRD
ncbi:6.1 kDa protein [Human adenovirus 41]|uniref:6.1 kDa protein n=1 Tax=Human adenovirus F serotype 41 TaxID=10524 RepID=A0A7U3RWW0_ADE41|nr:6.1 kDa protein [Human adenovirus 41]QOV03171.1 6.1 kDa protein [Human adenovirus 41]